MAVRLNHETTGAGRPLVLLHPVGLDRTFWGPLVTRAAASYEVHALDLAGHGASDPGPEGRSIQSYAADVLALLDHLGIGSATVLGLSFGGMITQELALLAPERVSRIIVGACGAKIPEAARAPVRARGTDALATGMSAIVDTTLTRWFTADFLNAPAVARVRERLLANRPEDWAAGWHAISTFDAESRLGQINVPALVVSAELDAGTAVPATKAIADAIPGAEFALLPGAPHMMQIECADRFSDLVLDFLARTDA